MEGIGWFTFETLKRMTISHPEHTFYFLFDRPFDPSFLFASNVKPVVVSPQARHPLLWYVWFEYSIPRILSKLNADVFLSSDGYLSLRSQIPALLVIHDLAFEHLPKSIPSLTRKYYQYFIPKYARKAKQIISVSDFSKQDLIKRYHIAASKIEVAPNAAKSIFQMLSEEDIETTRNEITNGAAYFLFVSALQPRKNLPGLLRAFDHFKNHHNDQDIKLVVAGAKYSLSRAIDDALKGMTHRSDVIFTGHLSPEKLAAVTGAALALTYVSFFEGFGIPILEAMQAGVPVICSNTSSMPGVAGDAALLVNPNSLKDISEAMTKVSSDQALRKELINKGLKRAQAFSWDKTADIIWKVLLKTAAP